MHDLISSLKSGQELAPADVVLAVELLVSSSVPDSGKADFLKALRQKGETAGEMAAFVEALLAHAVDPGLIADRLPGPMIDICGTGGDKLELFNISTASMFVLAAGGAVVVKHGNRAITSLCGGADVLETLGVRIDLTPEQLRQSLETLGLGFVFAPSYHPAFKAIGPVRKALAAEGIPTIFNLLGPLLNPARPPFQFVGIYDRQRLPMYVQALQKLGRKKAWAVHGDGMDELSTCGMSEIHEVSQGGVRTFEVHPEQLGIRCAAIQELKGGNPSHNAQLLTGILDGTIGGPMHDVVAMNAAAGFVVCGVTSDLAEGMALAREQLASGRALEKLRGMQAFSAGLPVSS